jgi:hypothetical protein
MVGRHKPRRRRGFVLRNVPARSAALIDAHYHLRDVRLGLLPEGGGTALTKPEERHA